MEKASQNLRKKKAKVTKRMTSRRKTPVFSDLSVTLETG